MYRVYYTGIASRNEFSMLCATLNIANTLADILIGSGLMTNVAIIKA